MKVEYDGNIVRDAFYKVDSAGCCSFIMDTVKKRMEYYVSGSSDNGVGCYYERCYHFPIDGSDSMENEGFAIFTAECEEDLEYLNRIDFQLWDGDQLWIVSLSDDVLGFDKE